MTGQVDNDEYQQLLQFAYQASRLEPLRCIRLRIRRKVGFAAQELPN
jgi:hypothetical protein